MVKVTDHQLRCATLLWVYTHTNVHIYSHKASMIAQHGADAVRPEESTSGLIQVLKDAKFMVDQALAAGLPKAQLEEFWAECVEGWDLDFHDALAVHLRTTGALATQGQIDPHEGPILTALAERRTSLRLQGDADWVAAQLLDDEAPTPEGFGAW